jgi:hypothetical protein
VIGAAAVVLVLVVVGLAAGGVFSSGGGGGGGSSTATTKPHDTDSVTLTAGAAKVEAPILFTKFPDGVADAVMGAVTKYVDDGIVTALRKGHADDADLAGVVDAGVTAQLAGADRGVLFDEGLPAATGKLTVTGAPVDETALVGTDGRAAIVVAGIHLDVTATTKRGPVHITRTGDLQFAPDATGAWKLTGYDLTVNREGKGVPTAAAGTTTTGAGKGGGK